MRKKNQFLRATPAECRNPDLRRATPGGSGVTPDSGIEERPEDDVARRVPNVIKMRRPRTKIGVPIMLVHQRRSCGSSYPVIVIGLSGVENPPAGVQRNDGRRAVKRFLGKGG